LPTARSNSAEPLLALARNLAEGLDYAVLAMRYPVGDAFAIEFAGRFYRALLEQRRSLPAALQLVLPQALPPTAGYTAALGGRPGVLRDPRRRLAAGAAGRCTTLL